MLTSNACGGSNGPGPDYEHPQPGDKKCAGRTTRADRGRQTRHRVSTTSDGRREASRAKRGEPEATPRQSTGGPARRFVGATARRLD